MEGESTRDLLLIFEAHRHAPEDPSNTALRAVLVINAQMQKPFQQGITTTAAAVPCLLGRSEQHVGSHPPHVAGRQRKSKLSGSCFGQFRSWMKTCNRLPSSMCSDTTRLSSLQQVYLVQHACPHQPSLPGESKTCCPLVMLAFKGLTLIPHRRRQTDVRPCADYGHPAWAATAEHGSSLTARRHGLFLFPAELNLRDLGPVGLLESLKFNGNASAEYCQILGKKGLAVTRGVI